jgi:hypothetical protein
MAANPTIKRYTADNSELNASGFVPLIVPVDSNAYLLKNSGPDICYMRSDPADPDTEDELGPGAAESLMGSRANSYGRTARYQTGETLYFVKCSGPLIGKFWC